MDVPTLSPDLAHDAGLRLVGTTDHEETAINAVLGTDLEPGEADDLIPEEELAEIYDVVDRCRCCDWWFEVGELDEDYACPECG